MLSSVGSRSIRPIAWLTVTGHALPPRRRPAERLAAWLVTGPLGHLYSAVADLAVFGARSLRARVRRGRTGG